MREMIEDGIRRILQDQVTPGVLAAAARGEWSQPLWNLLEKSGFSRALCSPAHGGSDASWSDVHPLLVASGFHCLPLPLPETLLACSLLERAGIEPPEGPIGVPDQPVGVPLSLKKSGGGWRLDGELVHVPWGRHCQHLIAQASHAGEMFIVLLGTEGLDTQPNLNLAREPRDTFLLRDARPLRVSASPFAQPDPIRLYGALLRSAQTAGAARRTLEQAVQYAGERVQFGRPLAKFQAVQQQIAMAVSEVAAITAAADHACEAAASGDLACAVAIAKITAAEAAGKVAAVGHAVHGAIGYTAEHSLHHATQRLWSWRSEFGNLRWWSERLGRAICAQGADRAWNSLIDGELEILT
jgi:acyl-CoA dehydrogenase